MDLTELKQIKLLPPAIYRTVQNKETWETVLSVQSISYTQKTRKSLVSEHWVTVGAGDPSAGPQARAAGAFPTEHFLSTSSLNVYDLRGKSGKLSDGWGIARAPRHEEVKPRSHSFQKASTTDLQP